MFRFTLLLIMLVSEPTFAQDADNQPDVDHQQQAVSKQRTVFDLPSMLVRQQVLQKQIASLFNSQDFITASAKCRESVELFPDNPLNHYLLACCQSRLGNVEEGLASLERAVDNGFSQAELIQKDANLRPLSQSKKFAELIKRAPNAKRAEHPLLARSTLASPFDEKIALVSQSNTSFNTQYGVFQTSFKSEYGARLSGSPMTNQKTDVGLKVRQWYRKGTGAGLRNHLYDNHDRGHSPIGHQAFPQLRLVKYCDEAHQLSLDRGLQLSFFYNMITIGNASEALTGTTFWRSMPRLAYSSPRNMTLLNLQYTSNHLYVYPEHRDHDPQTGDMFASNSPYLLISQGSSGSDRKLLEAVAWTLASFHPKAKKKLADGGALMAAVQMVFRRTNKRVQSVEDYLSGKAHPTVFDGETIDVMRMIRLAHKIQANDVPAMIQLNVIEEDDPVLGVDYFDDEPRVKFYETPAAISRLLKSTKRTYRMVVSAKKSFDLNDHPLTYHWRVLRGDANEIEINPLNEDHSVVEIIVPHQEERPVETGSELTSRRVDIGAFVHNGSYYSAPAFVSLHSPRNEIRKYNDQGNIESVEYVPFKKQYADPLLTTPRQWTDHYIYDDQHRLIGWNRIRNSSTEEFTAQGALVIQKDELGRPLQARTIRYQRSADPKQKQILEQLLGPEVLHYSYDSPTDKIGRIAKRVPAS